MPAWSGRRDGSCGRRTIVPASSGATSLATLPTKRDGDAMAEDNSFRTIIRAEFPYASVDTPGDDLIVSALPGIVFGRADCCPATAAVRVVFHTTPARRTRTELRLCAHHYRASYRKLTQAGAIAFDSTNTLISSTEPVVSTARCFWPPV